MSELFEHYLTLAQKEEKKNPISETIMTGPKGTSKKMLEPDPAEEITDIEDAPDIEENKEDPNQPEKPNNEKTDEEVKREITVKAWLKELDARFKPLATFEKTEQENSKGEKEQYISLIPYGDEGKARIDKFYHIGAVPKLTNKVKKEIITLADGELRGQSLPREDQPVSKKERLEKKIKKKSLNENIKIPEGWIKLENKNSVAEFQKIKMDKSDDDIFMEIVSPEKPGTFKNLNKGYTVIVYNATSKSPIDIKKSITTENKVKKHITEIGKRLTYY